MSVFQTGMTMPANGARNIDQRFYPEVGAGGFNRLDGTLQFYLRVNALVRPEMTVVDLGAGRGAMVDPPSTAFRNGLVTLKGRVARMIGVDVDPVVTTNPLLDEAHVYEGGRLPLADGSVDLLLSDYTFEHIPDAAVFAAEITRVLKPGGWLCARTPHLFSAVAVAASLAPNRLHPRLLNVIQPGRQERDVFPTCYKLNTRRALARHFPASGWENYSYTWSPNPGYHFNNPWLYRALLAFQYLKAPFLGGEVLMIFLRRRSAQAA